jgi:arylsulfatase A-like enzyme
MTVGILALLAGSATAASTPNVVVFYSDDMGNGDLACYGAKDVKTPNIDALAASGIRFTNYYAAAPICSPSRAAMLTGRYPARAGLSSKKNIASNMNAPGLPTREVTIAELAKKAGYATAVFGKWHLGSIHECQPNSQGFDLFVGHHASCLDSFSHMYYASEPWYYDLYRNREEIYEDGVHITDLITRETLRFIDDHRGERFLIYVAYNTPHYPMVARGKFVQMYAGLPKPRQVWAASVTELDDSVGQIMSRLRERDLLKDTLVFFASDNGAPNESLRGEGGGSNAPYREYKRSLFEGGIRVPGMVSGQGLVPAGVVCDQPVIGMDFFSTIAEAIHAEVPKDRTIDGASWYPLFKDPTQSVHDVLFFEWDDQHAVRSGDWKLVENGLLGMAVSRTNRATGDDAVFLSNIKVDSGEQHNLRGEHADVAERLVKLHEAWRREIAQDPTASPDALATSKPEPARGGRFDRE